VLLFFIDDARSLDLVGAHCRHRCGVLYVRSLRQFKLSQVGPLFALVFVVVPLAAVLILGEHLPPLRTVGLVLIFVGVILVGQTA
jgi:uncharacterized membrane protein